LIGRIYDDQGNRMSPSHARKQGIRYPAQLRLRKARQAGKVREA
jgi:hypothetical protein